MTTHYFKMGKYSAITKGYKQMTKLVNGGWKVAKSSKVLLLEKIQTNFVFCDVADIVEFIVVKMLKNTSLFIVFVIWSLFWTLCVECLPVIATINTVYTVHGFWWFGESWNSLKLQWKCIKFKPKKININIIFCKLFRCLSPEAFHFWNVRLFIIRFMSLFTMLNKYDACFEYISFQNRFQEIIILMRAANPQQLQLFMINSSEFWENVEIHFWQRIIMETKYNI